MNKEYCPYETDASQIHGKAKEIVIPETIAQVQGIIRSYHSLCIRGAGTGLSGGCVPLNGQDTVIDLSQLNNIGEIDATRKTIEVEAGVILSDLQEYLTKFNLEFPIEPLSKHVCTIGGMVATNATSPRDIKYKQTQEWVRWIEVIDDKGNIDRKGKTEISDYSGMEGISGIIIKICLNLIEKKKRTASLVKINDSTKILPVLRHVKSDPDVSMAEFFDKKISFGIGLEEKYHILVEYENQNGIFQNDEYERIMKKRNEVFSFLTKEGYTRFEDPKIMIDKFTEYLEWCEVRNIPVTANLGSGIIYPSFFKDQESLIPQLHKLVKMHGGKVSGSYGIGILKNEYVEFNDKKIIENIKKRTDASGKFNRGKVI